MEVALVAQVAQEALVEALAVGPLEEEVAQAIEEAILPQAVAQVAILAMIDRFLMVEVAIIVDIIEGIEAPIMLQGKAFPVGLGVA